MKNLPIISPHGHVDSKIFAENKPFPDPTELFIIPDHYIFRMLYSQGYSLESLGISTQDGTPVEKDHRKIWQIFGENFYLYAGTPTGAWLTHEFAEVFGVTEKLNGENAITIYDLMSEKLLSPEFLLTDTCCGNNILPSGQNKKTRNKTFSAPNFFKFFGVKLPTASAFSPQIAQG